MKIADVEHNRGERSAGQEGGGRDRPALQSWPQSLAKVLSPTQSAVTGAGVAGPQTEPGPGGWQTLHGKGGKPK